MSPPPVASLRIEPAEALAHSALSVQDLNSKTSATHGIGIDLAWAGVGGVVGLLAATGLTVPGTGGWLAGVVGAALACFVLAVHDADKSSFLTGLGSFACVVVSGVKVARAGWAAVFVVGGAGVVVAGATLAALRVARASTRRTDHARRLRQLYAEVGHFNRAVEVAVVQQRLETLGAARPLSPQLLGALSSARAELLRALAIDRVLRDHADLLRDRASEHVSAFFPTMASQVKLEASERIEALATSLSAVAEARAIWERELAG